MNQPQPTERPERSPSFWPDWIRRRWRAPWPWPANPKYHLPKEPGDQVWDDPYWYA